MPCTPTDVITTYDVSISAQSGLQVPKNYVSGTEREFVVTVANAGPDAATGNVVVTGVLASGGVVPGSPWTFAFAELLEGQSAPYTQLFSVTVQGTDTIEWSATIYAPYDLDASNNSATATSSVRAGGGGNGGNRP